MEGGPLPLFFPRLSSGPFCNIVTISADTGSCHCSIGTVDNITATPFVSLISFNLYLNASTLGAHHPRIISSFLKEKSFFVCVSLFLDAQRFQFYLVGSVPCRPKEIMLLHSFRQFARSSVKWHLATKSTNKRRFSAEKTTDEKAAEVGHLNHSFF